MLKCSSALGSDPATTDIILMGITGRTMATRITGRIIGTVATATTATIIATITGTNLTV
jgi:hypothetical protein